MGTGRRSHAAGPGRGPGPTGGLHAQPPSPRCPTEREPQAQFLFVFAGGRQHSTKVQNQTLLSSLHSVGAAKTIASLCWAASLTQPSCAHISLPLRKVGRAGPPPSCYSERKPAGLPRPAPVRLHPRNTCGQGDAVPFVRLPLSKQRASCAGKPGPPLRDLPPPCAQDARALTLAVRAAPADVPPAPGLPVHFPPSRFYIPGGLPAHRPPSLSTEHPCWAPSCPPISPPARRLSHTPAFRGQMTRRPLRASPTCQSRWHRPPGAPTASCAASGRLGVERALFAQMHFHLLLSMRDPGSENENSPL